MNGEVCIGKIKKLWKERKKDLTRASIVRDGRERVEDAVGPTRRAEHDNATPTVAPAAPRCGLNYDRFVTQQPEKQGKIKGPMLWVKRRGNLEDGGFQSKCNGPNGLSLKLINIQSLES